VAFVSEVSRKLLDAAFATNDLECICRAVDESLVRYSTVTEMAKAAGVDRTTLYRAFRIKNGPALDTMIKVLRALGFELIVEAGKQAITGSSRRRAKNEPDAKTKALARRFTAAFRSGNIDLLFDTFAQALRAQENVTAFAKNTIRSREWLYHVFTGPKTPRFSTVLSFLNALNLRFSLKLLFSNRTLLTLNRPSRRNNAR
jgi:probable addiction module antidote protein